MMSLELETVSTLLPHCLQAKFATCDKTLLDENRNLFADSEVAFTDNSES
jgi:hypothetical protein